MPTAEVPLHPGGGDGGGGGDSVGTGTFITEAACAPAIATTSTFTSSLVDSITRSKLARQLIQDLNAKTMDELRGRFLDLGDALSDQDFVLALRWLFVPREQREDSPRSWDRRLVSILCEIHASALQSAGVRGNRLSWEGFTTYLVHMTTYQQMDAVEPPEYSHKESTQVLRCDRIWRVGDRILWLEPGSKSFCCTWVGCQWNRKARRRYECGPPSAEGIIQDVVWSEETAKYFAATSDRKILVFDERVAGREPVRIMTVGQTPQCLILSGTALLVGCADGSLSAPRDGGTGISPGLGCPQRAIIALLLIPEISQIASGSLDGLIKLWDTANDMALVTILMGHTAGVRCLCWSTTSKQILSGGFSACVLVSSPSVTSPIATLKGHESTIAQIHAIDGTYLALSVDCRAQFILWNTANSTILQRFCPPNSPKHFRGFIQQRGEDVMACAVDGLLHTFHVNLNDGRIRSDARPLLAAMYIPQSLLWVTVSSLNVKIWDRKGSILSRFKLHGAARQSGAHQETSVATCFDWQRLKLLVGNRDGRVTSHNLRADGATAHAPPEDRFCYKAFRGYAHQSRQVTKLIHVGGPSPLVISADASSVHVHDDAHGTQSSSIMPLQIVSSASTSDIAVLAHSGYMGLIAWSGNDGFIEIWSVSRGKLLGSAHHPAAVTVMLFLDPYSALLSSDCTGTLAIWGLSDSAPPQRLHYFVHSNRAAAISAALSEITVLRRANELDDTVVFRGSSETGSGACASPLEGRFTAAAARQEPRPPPDTFRGHAEHIFERYTPRGARRATIKMREQEHGNSEIGKEEPDCAALIFVADETGHITRYSLQSLLDKLGLVAHVDSDTIPIKPVRRFATDIAAETLAASHADALQRSQWDGDAADAAAAPPPCMTWQAHGGLISTFALAASWPPAIFSSGAQDKLARIWSFGGDRLGQLCDDNQKDWLLDVSVDAFAAQHLSRAEAVVHKLEEACTNMTIPKVMEREAPQTKVPKLDFGTVLQPHCPGNNLRHKSDGASCGPKGKFLVAL